MCEWKRSKLKDITIFIKDGTHGTHKDVPDGIPLLSAKDIENGKILIPDNCRTVSESDYKLLHANYEIENDDLLLTVVGTIGRVAIAKKLLKKITFQRSVSIIRIDKSKILPEYSFHYFQSFNFQQTLERSKNASAQGGVYLGELAKTRIFHPVLPSEQQKIAHILTTCDTVIEQTQSTIAKYKAIKQGLLHDLFTRGLDPNGRLRPSYLQSPELYKESELGMIPKEWKVKRLDKITEKIGSGVTPTGGSDVYQTSGVLFIRSQNVLIGSLSIEDAAFITTEIDAKMEYSRVKPFDVLLNITGASIGRCAFFPKELKSANVNQHVCIIRFIAISKSLAIYASEFMNSFFGQSQINKSIAGGNREGLNFQQIKSFYFPIISSTELEMIAKIIELQSNKIQTEETLLQKYQSIKRGLMGDLLGGRKEVK